MPGHQLGSCFATLPLHYDEVFGLRQLAEEIQGIPLLCKEVQLVDYLPQIECVNEAVFPHSPVSSIAFAS